MRLRQRIWPGLRVRSIVFDGVLALVGTIAVGLASISPGPLELPEPLLLVGAPLLFLTLWLFRRRAPLVPFAVSALLSAAAPNVSIGLPITSYAVGRYVG